MKQIFVFAFIFIASISFSQKRFVGTWKTVDDEDGKEKSQIQIYEQGGTLKAKIVKLLPAATTKICAECKGNLKNKPLEGLEIAWGLKKVSETEYDGGEILNPKNGKVYSCNMILETNDKIRVRGFLGFSLLGKTQYWYRVK